jgi:hypothetical protein
MTLKSGRLIWEGGDELDRRMFVNADAHRQRDRPKVLLVEVEVVVRSLNEGK